MAKTYDLSNNLFNMNKEIIQSGKHRAQDCRTLITAIKPVESLQLEYKKDMNSIKDNVLKLG